MMRTIRTDVIPDRVQLATTDGPDALDLQAICVFAATGFFLGEDHYLRSRRALQPATEYELDDRARVVRSRRYWDWHHRPRDITLDQAVDEFAHLFERISRDGLAGRRVILPLSGGLDSRTQAAVLDRTADVKAYSYKFENSFDETQYGRRIAKAKHIPFAELVIRRGYLWRVISELSTLNACEADFTHPRQMAVIDEIATYGDVFFLGHWGDVLFDDMGVDEALGGESLIDAVLAKIVRKGGEELAEALWTAWGLAGTFRAYLRERVGALLAAIAIDNANARIRAFKSLYWAPRWTSVNLAVFSSRRPTLLPYYHREMCELVCTLPERLLAGRQIQIEYLKRHAPALARIPWQSYHPLDLFTYRLYRTPAMLPYRAARKAMRTVRERITGAPTVSRNWEIQFVGPSNDAHLREHLYGSKVFAELVPPGLVATFYEKFTTVDRVKYAHPVSMLLTLSMFARSRTEARLAV